MCVGICVSVYVFIYFVLHAAKPESIKWFGVDIHLINTYATFYPEKVQWHYFWYSSLNPKIFK